MASATPTEMRASLDNVLQAGIDAATTLLDELAAERDALHSQDGDALECAAQQKQICLQEIETREQERKALLAKAGFADDRNGMLAMIERCAAGTEIGSQWQRYLAVAEECQQANTTNGAILRLRHQQIASALAVLSGCNPTTYGPTGNNDGGGSRALAEA
ncbi:MAG: flagellar protein FlgN [Woeseia sp.]|nr:flagellar protein FlgN [Woeseia sp.]NNE59811.1 flagellar protein FlgN [Woeseia sp.]NNL54144.1 flagellar protein FlgN [Woeseia sp.]